MFWVSLRKFGLYWIALVSGPLSVALMLKAASLTTSTEAILFWMGAYITGIIAGCAVWYKQNQAIKTLQAQLDARPRFADERKGMIREKWAALNERERYAIELILVLGGQTDDQLRANLRDRGYTWEGDMGELLNRKTEWLYKEFNGTWRMKPELKPYVEELF